MCPAASAQAARRAVLSSATVQAQVEETLGCIPIVPTRNSENPRAQTESPPITKARETLCSISTTAGDPRNVINMPTPIVEVTDRVTLDLSVIDQMQP